MITFNKDIFKTTKSVNEKPILLFYKIVFNSKDSTWTDRLFDTTLTIKIAGYDKEGRERVLYQVPVSLGAYINPYIKKPELNVIGELDYNGDFKTGPDFDKWKVFVELNNLTFKINETLDVDLIIIDKKLTQLMIDDWKKRIKILYSEIQTWFKDKPVFSLKKGNPVIMDEKYMQRFNIQAQGIDSADIYHKTRLILTFKPKGLFVIGANGIIDVISEKGGYMLIDQSKPFEFEKPIWRIFSNNLPQFGMPFNERELFRIL